MKRFLFGVAIGAALGFACAAVSMDIQGDGGFLYNWEVVVRGETLCYDPYVLPELALIECR